MTALKQIREGLPDETRKVLDLIWDSFLRTGTWPKTRIIGSRSGGPDELKRLLLPLDGSYVVESDPQEAPKLELRILGILSTAERMRYMKLIEGYLGFLRGLYQRHSEQEAINRAEVAESLHLSDADATDLGRLLGFMNFKGIFKASGSSSEAWQVSIPKRIDEIPNGPFDEFLEMVLAEYEEPGSKIWLDERLAQAIASKRAVGYYRPEEGYSDYGQNAADPGPFERRYQVFVSSTYKDLQEERERVAQALLLTRCIPTGMEFFPASGRPPWDVIRHEIDEADYYILIVAGRYGSLVPGEAISYTEREFDYAVETNKPVMAFCHNQVDKLPGDRRDALESDREKLAVFRAKVHDGRICKYWSTAIELESAVKTAVQYAILNERQPGWIRAGQVAIDPIAAFDPRTRASAEKLLEVTWAAEHQRIANEGLARYLSVLPSEARLVRDKMFEAGLLNRMDNLEKPESHWIVFTKRGKDYVLEKNIQHRITTVRSFGLSWNERKEAVCARCILPLPFFDNRSLRCSNCGTDFAPHERGTALSVQEAVRRYGGKPPL